MRARQKVRVACVAGRWHVTCEACDGDFLSMFSPWVVAGNHATAMTLARWHLRLHEDRLCGHCHRTDPLPKPQAIDTAHLSFDGKLYEVRNSGVVAIGTAAVVTR